MTIEQIEKIHFARSARKRAPPGGHLIQDQAYGGGHLRAGTGLSGIEGKEFLAYCDCEVS